MPDCPHIHVQDSGQQAFREFIREETDEGQTIARFLNDAVEGRLPDFQPQHRLITKGNHAEQDEKNHPPRSLPSQSLGVISASNDDVLLLENSLTLTYCLKLVQVNPNGFL